MRSRSGDLSEAIARAICVSTSPPIDKTPERMPSISTSNCLEVCSFTRGSIHEVVRSTESAGDVVLGLSAAGLEEDLVGCAELHQLAQVHVRRIVRDPRRLLHVMRHDCNRILALELGDELFDLGGGYWFYRSCALVVL